MTTDSHRLFSRETAARALDVSPSTIDRLRRSGKLRAVRVDGLSGPRFREADVAALVEGEKPKEGAK